MATSNTFAYNTGSTIAGTTQVGSLAVGVPSGGYGPTGLTWWNGPDEDLGYVIAYSDPSGSHTFPPSHEPGAYLGFKRTSVKTDDAFVALASEIANTSFSDAAQARTWLDTNGYWTSYGIVTLNLTLRLDASNSSSYSGSGSTWTDLATPRQDITLVNSPTYTSASPSYFTFNGSNQYGNGSGSVLSTTSYTKSVWFYLNGYADNNLVSSSAGGHFMYFSGGSNRMYCGHSDWPNYTLYQSSAIFSLNTWYNASLTFNTTDGMKLYINGSLDSSYTAIKTGLPGDGSTNIASYSAGNLLNGRISKIYCYDRSLSATEVLQNYNVDKSKFGL